MNCPNCNAEFEIVWKNPEETNQEPPYSKSMEESTDSVGKEKVE